MTSASARRRAVAAAVVLAAVGSVAGCGARLTDEQRRSGLRVEVPISRPAEGAS